ncbi:MAG: hypothetical protein EAZ99_03225 [Alphaproteobacteria bacterium]|nr:MAG: hypothetical protein EAZ99_03225 [Alphaproteobacteria bacterium]
MGATGFLLAVHIASGVVAVGGAGVAMGAAKGGVLHRWGGRVFATGMALACLAGLGLALIKPSLFLGVVAVFSLGLVLLGWRAIVAAPTGLDRAGAALFALLGVAMIASGPLGLVARGQGIVLAVFGVLALVLGVDDLARRGRDLRRHLQRMGGAVIAAVTAVLVVNGEALPELVRWLAPTVIGTAVIIATLRRYPPQRSVGER